MASPFSCKTCFKGQLVSDERLGAHRSLSDPILPNAPWDPTLTW
jgi:hypothetical protein